MCQETLRSRVTCKIIKNEAIAKGVYEMILDWGQPLGNVNPGQFVNLYCHHQGRLLPRPISICEVDKAKNCLHLVYAVMGDGTREIATYTPGELIETMGPLGNGFSLPEEEELRGSEEKIVLVGGGVGTPPMVELAKRLDRELTIVVGFREESYLVDRLSRYGTVYVATDNGSEGYKGNVIDLMKDLGISGKIYACGPTPMLKGLQAFARENQLVASLSLEERMGCGFGGCVGCVTKVVADNEAGYRYKKVCKDGPVFDSKEVIFS